MRWLLLSPTKLRLAGDPFDSPLCTRGPLVLCSTPCLSLWERCPEGAERAPSQLRRIARVHVRIAASSNAQPHRGFSSPQPNSVLPGTPSPTAPSSALRAAASGGCALYTRLRAGAKGGAKFGAVQHKKRPPEGVFFSIKLTQHPGPSASRAGGGPVRARRTSPRRAGRCDGPGPRTRSRCSHRNCCPSGPA